MRYEGAVYRPPSEGRSLIVQATIGCSHNKCTFCDMYKAKKFRMRNVDEVLSDLAWARERYTHIEKIFLADGDALIMPMDRLIPILTEIQKLFPECKRVTIYGTPRSILLKTVEELKVLKKYGLYMVYLGVESGDDEILARVKKGVTAVEMIEAGKRVKASGIKLSCTLISGLGGKEKWQQHAANSAKVINEIDPDYLGLLTLMVNENTSFEKEVNLGLFSLLSPEEVMVENYELVKGLNLTDCVFRSNHASNYVSLGGNLNVDKDILLRQMEEIVIKKNNYKEEYFRRF